MPTYCFVTDKGERIERFMWLEEFEALPCTDGWYTLESGERAYVDVAAQQTAVPSSRAWPARSDGMGCHPDQIPEMQAAMAQRGCPTEFDRKTGQAILTDRNHRRRAMRARGMHDKDGGYGDG